MPLERPTEGTHSLDDFAGHLTAALRELRTADSPGAMSGVMALCCRAYLGPAQCGFIAAIGLQASSAEFCDDMIRALEYDRRARKQSEKNQVIHEWEQKRDAEHWAKRLENAESHFAEYGHTDWHKEELARCRSYSRLYR